MYKFQWSPEVLLLEFLKEEMLGFLKEEILGFL